MAEISNRIESLPIEIIYDIINRLNYPSAHNLVDIIEHEGLRRDASKYLASKFAGYFVSGDPIDKRDFNVRPYFMVEDFYRSHPSSVVNSIDPLNIDDIYMGDKGALSFIIKHQKSAIFRGKIPLAEQGVVADPYKFIVAISRHNGNIVYHENGLRFRSDEIFYKAFGGKIPSIHVPIFDDSHSHLVGKEYNTEWENTFTVMMKYYETFDPENISEEQLEMMVYLNTFSNDEIFNDDPLENIRNIFTDEEIIRRLNDENRTINYYYRSAINPPVVILE